MTKLNATSSANLAKSLFKINNRPVILTEGQLEIFNSIFHLIAPRVQAITSTQYGKSETVSMAALVRSITFGENFIICAPSEKKAQIIMGYIIDHCFDNGFFRDQLQLDPGEKLDRLKRERSKSSITWLNGGGVKTLSLDARNGKKKLEAAMGFGGNRVILDESCLIDDDLYPTVVRMLGGYPYSDQFLFEIGNPFYRNHFLRSWQGHRHLKIFVDVYRALKEGRLSPEFVEEMRELPLFDVLYECKFPAEDEIDADGFRQLLTSEQVETTTKKNPAPPCDGALILGVDVAGGGDDTVFVLRDSEHAWVASKRKTKDTMSVVTEIIKLMDDYKIKPQDVFIDDIGVGRGVCDRLQELEYSVNAVSVGDKCVTEESRGRFFNIKAENYWATRNWVLAGGELDKGGDWSQLTWIKYKVNSDRTVQIEPKQNLKKRTGRSPDTAEALMLTFTIATPAPGIWVMD